MTDLKTAGATLPEHPADKTAKPVAPEVAPVTQPEKSTPEAAPTKNS